MGQWQSRHVEEEEFVREVKEMKYEEKQVVVNCAREATPSDAYLFGYLDRIVSLGRKTNEVIAQAIIQAPTIECLKDDRIPPLIRKLINLSPQYDQQQALLGVFTKYLNKGLYHNFIYECATNRTFILRIGDNMKDKNHLEFLCKWVESLPWTGKLLHFFCSSFLKLVMIGNEVGGFEGEFIPELEAEEYDDKEKSEDKYKEKETEKDTSGAREKDIYEDKGNYKINWGDDDCYEEYQPPAQAVWSNKFTTSIATRRERTDLRLKELDNLAELHAHDPSAPWFVNPLLLPTNHSKNKYSIVDAHKTQLERVTELYKRCPVPGYDIKCVQVVYNERLTTMFSSRVKMLQARIFNSAFTPHWTDSTGTALRTKVMELFRSLCHPYEAAPSVSLIPLWHGSNLANLEGIFSAGFANLATTDAGFFGKGIYGTPEAEYAHRVFSRGALLLNWVAVFSAYPVIYQDEEELAEKANFGNYDAHFVPVYSPKHPNTRVYHACNYGEEAQYSELVVFDSAQVLPQFIVELQPSLIPNPTLLPLPTILTTQCKSDGETSNDHSPSTSYEIRNPKS